MAKPVPAANTQAPKPVTDADRSSAVYKISKCVTRLQSEQPFFGVLLTGIDRIEAPAYVPTMGVDGKSLYYNTHFVLSLTDEELTAVLLHELDHIIYLHCATSRRGGRDARKLNVAQDHAINIEIKDMGMTLPKDCLYDDKYRDMVAEQIYDKLPDSKNYSVSFKGQSLGADGQGHGGFDVHMPMPNEGITKEEVTDSILAAAEFAKTRNRGSLPAGIERWIEKLKKSKVKWSSVFQNYVGQVMSNRDDYSYSPCRRAFVHEELYLPAMRSPKIEQIVIAIDTSGSIDKATLDEFAAEINKLFTYVEEVVVMTCDAAVHEVVKVTDVVEFLKKIKFKGGGGTSSIPVFEEVKKRNYVPELLVFFTDGFTEYPPKGPDYPMIWCFCTGHSDEKPPFGLYVEIPPTKDRNDT